jgi:MFS transporter, DHA1 family, multidrug resistance protein
VSVVVHCLVFIAFVDNFAMLPTIAPYAATLGADLTATGTVVAAYSLTNLLLNIVGGVLLDRSGRRRLAVLGFGGTAAAVALYPLAQTPVGLVGVRLLHGAAGGVLVPAVFTVVSDLTAGRRATAAMGRVGALIGLAAVVGPAAAGFLRQSGTFTTVFVTVSATMFTGCAIALRWLPETTPLRRRTGSPVPLSELVRRSELRSACAAVFALTFSVGTLAAFLPLHVESLGLAPAATGLLFTLYAAVAAVVMLASLGDRLGHGAAAASIATGLVALALSLTLLAGRPGVAGAVLAVAVFGLGFGLVFPAATAAVSAAAGPRARGAAFGIFLACFSLGFVVGPPLGGAVGQTLPEVGPFLPAVALCAATGAWLWLRGRPTPGS